MKNIFYLSLTICFLATETCFSADRISETTPLVRVLDINVGESRSVRLCSGKEVSVKLLDLQERRDRIRQAVREARVMVAVNGKQVELTSATYHLPTKIGEVQIDCPVTKGYNSNGSPEAWALDKDARLRLWPADSPLLRPGTFVYPAKQRWFASLTQMCNVPVYVDGCERPEQKSIYYHYGLDIGGCEGLTEVVAATDGLVVSSGLEVLPKHRKENDTPVNPRYDVVYLLDARGWYYRYSHLKEIDETIKPGRVVKMGGRIGLLGKEGGSGGWSHLHFGIKARQPSGRWGEQEGYAFLWEANLRQHKPKLIAVARPHRLVLAGEEATLDGSRSWSVTGKITKFEWRFDDGTTAKGAKVTRVYAKPGCYSEVLKVTDTAGNVAYDFGIVQVLDGDHLDRRPPMIHPTYWPAQNIRAGDPIKFKVRTFGTTDGKEVWDFGDGSEKVEVQSDGNAKKLDPNGYAVTTHSFKEPGDYIVRVKRTNRDAISGVGHLHVRVGSRDLPVTPNVIKSAIRKSIPLLEKTAAGTSHHRKCFTCHGHAMPVLAITEARKRGFEIDEENLQAQLKHTVEDLTRGKAGYLKGRGQGGRHTRAGYALWTLKAGGWKSDELTNAVCQYLVFDEKAEHWRSPSNRPPSEVSAFTATYLALRGLADFGTDKQADRIATRKKKALDWLIRTEPKETEDRVFRLLALKQLDVGKAEIASAAKQLIETQRIDGGWAQIADRDSDAYATGSALFALHQGADMSPDDEVYQRGVKYLLGTQLGDGSWHVRSRSKPFQKYYESGYPHKNDQFISMAAGSWATLALLFACPPDQLAAKVDGLPFETFTNFDALLQNATTKYDKAIRVTPLGTTQQPADHGFFFYNCLQFDPTGRYMLAMRVFCREQEVSPDDIGKIGVVDLKEGNRWIEVGQSTAWNWQQGCRLQWRPKSNEIMWNDRDESGKKFICRVYDFKTKKRRSLPRPIYALSPNGSVALTHDFERMQHGGTNYVGLVDPNANQYAPKSVGIWKMDLDTGETKMIASLADVVKHIPSGELPKRGPIYFFREGWNLSGNRFIAFVKAPGNRLNKAFSMSADGSDLRYLYHYPSHHAWIDDRHVMDFAYFGSAVKEGDEPEKAFFLYKDDNTGVPAKLLWKSNHDGHSSRHPNGDWIISDTYAIDGCQYLFLFHLPSRKFVSLGKFAVKAPNKGIFRVDLHPRVSPDGNTVSIDSTHEFQGRQIYNIDISEIVSSPPK